MKLLSTAAILVLIFASCGGGAQTADNIIAKNIEARGGYEKVKSLKSVMMEGRAVTGNKSLPMNVYYDNLKAMRTEYIEGKNKAYIILTTTAGWTYNPVTDSVPVPTKDIYVKDGIFQLDIQGLFVDYKTKGYKAEYNGKDTAGGKQCDKITLKKEGEGDKIYFFDAASLLQKVTTYRLRDGGKYVPVDVYFFDYRNTDEGYLFSYRRSSSTAQYLFDKVTANAVMPQSLFQPNR
jgi:hypothetical protein